MEDVYRWAVAQRMINDACALTWEGAVLALCPEFGAVAFQREYRLTEAGGGDAVVVGTDGLHNALAGRRECESRLATERSGALLTKRHLHVNPHRAPSRLATTTSAR